MFTFVELQESILGFFEDGELDGVWGDEVGFGFLFDVDGASARDGRAHGGHAGVAVGEFAGLGFLKVLAGIELTVARFGGEDEAFDFGDAFVGGLILLFLAEAFLGEEVAFGFAGVEAEGGGGEKQEGEEAFHGEDLVIF